MESCFWEKGDLQIPFIYLFFRAPGDQGLRPPTLGTFTRYKKAVFVEYTDASFTQTKSKPAWMGKKNDLYLQPNVLYLYIRQVVFI